MPKLTGQLKYYYSNCQTNQTFVKENVTIEIMTNGSFINSGIQLNQDGTFNISQLKEQNKYRVKTVGYVSSGKQTQPVYTDLIYEIPFPQILDVIFQR